MKKTFVKGIAMVMALAMLTACGGSDTSSTPNSSSSTGAVDAEITVVSREESSGTRGAFDEIMGIKVKNGDTETNQLFEEAVTVTSTDAVSAKVEVDPYAIGYTSLGSVNDSIKAVAVDGVAATADNIKNGSYSIARPFVLATTAEASPLAQDFLSFMTSKQGQALVADKGYIAENDAAEEYAASGLTGKITLSGSTSVEKVMEKAKEDYLALNPGVEIEITYSGSGAGIKDVTSGKVDIGMSSRALTAEEQNTLTGTVFARDGIAVIVNRDNAVSDLTAAQITSIFKGEIRNWSEVN